MSRPTFMLAFRLRLAATASAAAGLIAVIVLAGALFPAVGHTIGRLHLPKGAANLLGGADYSTVAGWFKGEIASVYGPLVVAAMAITGAAGTIAGEEEDGTLALVLGHPLTRSQLVMAKAAAVGAGVLVIAAGAWVGLGIGVALAGGGIGLADQAALALHVAGFGLASGAVALALAAGTGRRGLAVAGAAGFALVGYLISGFAPLVHQLGWLRYLSPYHYYAAHDPLVNGIGVADLAVLAAFALALVGIGVAGMQRRDVRA